MEQNERIGRWFQLNQKSILSRAIQITNRYRLPIDDAHDLVQITLIKLLKVDNHIKQEDIFGYFLQAFKNELITAYRKNQRRPKSLNELEDICNLEKFGYTLQIDEGNQFTEFLAHCDKKEKARFTRFILFIINRKEKGYEQIPRATLFRMRKDFIEKWEVVNRL